MTSTGVLLALLHSVSLTLFELNYSGKNLMFARISRSRKNERFFTIRPRQFSWDSGNGHFSTFKHQKNMGFGRQVRGRNPTWQLESVQLINATWARDYILRFTNNQSPTIKSWTFFLLLRVYEISCKLPRTTTPRACSESCRQMGSMQD